MVEVGWLLLNTEQIHSVDGEHHSILIVANALSTVYRPSPVQISTPPDNSTEWAYHSWMTIPHAVAG